MKARWRPSIANTPQPAGHRDHAAALSDAASLLWRLKLHGVDVGERWKMLLAGWNVDAPNAGISAFNDVHVLLALIGAGEIGRAAAWTHASLAAAEKSSGRNHEVMRDIGAPLMRGLVSSPAGRHDAAAEAIHRVRLDSRPASAAATRSATSSTRPCSPRRAAA